MRLDSSEIKYMSNHCLEWDKFVLTNFDHNGQWFNILIPPSQSHKSAAVTVDCISRLSGQVRLSVLSHHVVLCQGVSGNN